MPRRPRLHFPGAIFHVMSRGVEGRPIFGGPEDFRAFVSIMAWVQRHKPFTLYAYCLMPNHYHLLVEVGDIALWRIMHQMLTRYAIRFNELCDRQGYLFQSRYKEILCSDDAYFKELLRYIHLNPVRAGLERQIGEWPWSSLGEYLSPRCPSILDTKFPLAMFHDDPARAREVFRKFLSQGLAQQAGFCDPPPGPDHEAQEPPPCRPQDRDLDKIAAQVAAEAGVSLDLLRGEGRARWLTPARRLFVLRAMQAGFTQAQIAVFLSRTGAAVSKLAGTAIS